MKFSNRHLEMHRKKFEDTVGLVRMRRKDNTMAKKDKQRSTKHTLENCVYTS